MMDREKKTPMKLFVVVFVALVALVAVQNLMREKKVGLSVQDNAGVTVLETVGDRLVSVFEDGRVAVWGWGDLPPQQGDFRAVSDRVIILNAEHIAAVNKTGKKVMTVYNLPDGQKQKDLSVGWEDQDIWLRISPDKKIVALIRQNASGSKGSILYEFLTLDMNKELTGSPVPLSIQPNIEEFVDYAVSNNGCLYAVGSKDDTGRIAAVDFKKGTVVWDIGFEDTKEFCSIAISPNSRILYAGNRDGFLYTVNAESGEIVKKIQLLEDGETRPITNDYSVLNLAFSGDGEILAATITPKAYLLKKDDHKIIFSAPTGAKLSSKTAFSPDSRSFATSDIRAGKPIYIHKMQEGK